MVQFGFIAADWFDIIVDSLAQFGVIIFAKILNSTPATIVPRSKNSQGCVCLNITRKYFVIFTYIKLITETPLDGCCSHKLNLDVIKLLGKEF